MAPQRIRLRFDGQDRELSIPATWRVLGELEPVPTPAVPSVIDALHAALEAPLGVEAYGPGALAGKRIVLAVDDISRPTPTHLFFAALVEWLVSRGARRDDLEVLFALGVHRDMTQAEAERKLGPGLAGIRWANHDARSDALNVELGTTRRGTWVALDRRLTEADLILCVGAIEPHLLLGFGGGLKMILPGLAHQRTIAENHMQGVTPEKFNYVGVAESPMRLDLEEAAGMLGRPIFLVNAILNERVEIARFVAGDPVRAHREGLALVRAMSGAKVREPADVAIVVSDPMNADLRQGMKCVGNAEPSVKEGGVILALLACQGGIGDLAVPPRTLPHGVLRLILRVIGRKRVLGFVDRVKKGAGVEERFLAHFSLQIARKIAIMIYSERLPPDTGARLGVFRQFQDLEAMVAAAVKAAPKDATVYVYRHGGATYPVLTGAVGAG
jgi:nickel-dependent lactate racemase